MSDVDKIEGILADLDKIYKRYIKYDGRPAERNRYRILRERIEALLDERYAYENRIKKLKNSVNVKDLHLVLTSGDNKPEHNRIKHYAAKELYNFIGGHDDT